MTRKALGRGLSALLRETDAPAPQPDSLTISLSLIDPNPSQPRRSFSEDTLKELADSVRVSGVIQPILVRPSGGGRYQLVAGERRWRAAKLASLESIPVVVRQLSDEDSLELALTENLMRDDLNPIEVARAYQALQDAFKLTHDEIAQRLGVSRVAVTNTLRLLKLPEAVQKMISDGQLSGGHARALLSIDSASDQIRAAREIVARDLSVRQVETLVGRAKSQPKPQGHSAPAEPDANVRAAVQELERALGTKVKITGDGKKGSIEIRYYSAEDLDRLYGLMLKAASTQS